MNQGRALCCRRDPSPLTYLETSPPCWGCCHTAASSRSGGDGPSPSPAEVVLITLFQLSDDTDCCLQSEAGSSLHAKLQGLRPADKSFLCKPQGSSLQIKTTKKRSAKKGQTTK